LHTDKAVVGLDGQISECQSNSKGLRFPFSGSGACEKPLQNSLIFGALDVKALAVHKKKKRKIILEYSLIFKKFVLAMSHRPNTTSPEGTLISDRTVGELVAERPSRSRIFQSFQIDFCCQGGRTLREGCERKGVPLATVLEQLELESQEIPADLNNPAELPLHDLIDHIIENHHAFLRCEFPRLRAMSERVANVHGGHTPSLVEVFDVYCGLEAELNSHMMKEERILFPAVSAISRGDSGPVSLDGPIACMIHEHDDAGAALARLHELTAGYNPPADACNTYRALFAGLADLEEDLHRHIHLENSVLFPAAQRMIAEAV